MILLLKPLKAKNTIQKAEFRQSHLKGKQAWEHQLLTTTLSCGKKILPYSVQRYKNIKKAKFKWFVKQQKVFLYP